MSLPPDQQPIQRIVGNRKSRKGQQLTGPELKAARDAVTRSTSYFTRAPKGVFFYSSHEGMAADRLRWTVDLMVELDREGKVLMNKGQPAESG